MPNDRSRNHSHDHAHAHEAHQDDHGTSEDTNDLLLLDAVVLADYWSDALTWVAAGAVDTTVARVVDLGAGTGSATTGLAERFPEAQVVAVDVSSSSLERLQDEAVHLGLGDRVSTVVADVDSGWPDLGPVDLIWASMSLHHLADPVAVLRQAREVTRPGGVAAVAEFAEALRFLPDDLGVGRPGFESRLAALLQQTHTELMPLLGSAWAPRLTEAGWAVADERDFAIDLHPAGAQDPDALRYARTWFARLREWGAERLDADDRAVLDALLDDAGPHALVTRTDLHIRGVRTVTLAHRDPR